MQEKKPIFKFHLCVIFILLLFHGVNNFIWLNLDKHPPIDDEAFHLVNALQYLDIISRPSVDMFLKLLHVNKFYPPLFPLIASCFGLVFGRTETILVMTNLLFLFGIFISLYLIGIKIQDRRLGLLASVILSFYPMFFHLSRMFMLEIALVFMVVASIAALIYSAGFKKRGPSLLFGLLLGLGLLTKQYYIVFIFGPLFFLLVVSFFSSGPNIKKKIFINLLLSFIIGLSIASLWYIPNLERMMPIIINAASDSSLVPHDTPVHSLHSFLFYLDMLVNEQILLFFFLIFIFSLFTVLKRKKDSEFLFLFLIWILAPYVIFSLFNNKFWYYTLAYLPAVALISSYGLLNITKKHLRRVAILMIVVIGLFQFFFISYADAGYRDSWFDLFGLKIRILPQGMRRIIGVSYSPRKVDWNIGAIISHVLKESEGEKPVLGIPDFDANTLRRSGVLLQNNYIGVNFDFLRYYFKLKNISYEILLLRNANDDKSIERINFIITLDVIENINTYGLKKEHYYLLRDFILPDGSSIYLYKERIFRNRSGRIDIYSQDLAFELEDVKAGGTKNNVEYHYARWLDLKDQKKHWVVECGVGDEWEQLWIEFSPLASGYVLINLRGSFYKDIDIRHHDVWVDDCEAEGALIKNGDFEMIDPNDRPAYWGWGGSLERYSTDHTQARSGNCCVLIWHDIPLINKIEVMAGKRYRISAWFKAP